MINTIKKKKMGRTSIVKQVRYKTKTRRLIKVIISQTRMPYQTAGTSRLRDRERERKLKSTLQSNTHPALIRVEYFICS